MQYDVLDKPATVGDILAWNMAIPAVITAWAPLYVATAIVPKFKTMFASFGGILPFVTVFVIDYGGIFTLVVTAISLALVFIGLFKIADHGIRIACLVLANFLLFSSLGVCVYAIYYPILELQSAVRGG